ncbi:MAG: hypothetical protein Ta2F_17370 [Termitinemataceae bacterium]|nr:MAG: hypothetical protein Ta2F_17370 [Termitinemataceae bacterium]
MNSNIVRIIFLITTILNSSCISIKYGLKSVDVTITNTTSNSIYITDLGFIGSFVNEEKKYYLLTLPAFLESDPQPCFNKNKYDFLFEIRANSNMRFSVKLNNISSTLTKKESNEFIIYYTNRPFNISNYTEYAYKVNKNGYIAHGYSTDDGISFKI